MRMPIVVLSIVSLLFVIRVVLAVYFAKATNKDWKKALIGCWRGLVFNTYLFFCNCQRNRIIH